MNDTQLKNVSEAENWPGTKIVLIALFCLLIIITVIGNTLVILSVLTTRRLRTVTNLFVMSLAVADWLVGIFVMPPAVVVFSVGSWPLGWILCELWISMDVLLCTASILSLCAISIDRYLAVTQPLNYSKRRRSKRLAMLMILIVWILAAAITCPPILGWYDQERKADMTDCAYNDDKGYVIYSAFGSFFIPMSIMLYVYSKIFCVLTSRQSRMSRTEVKYFSVWEEQFKYWQACERAIDVDNEFVTSEVDSCYPQSSKDLIHNMRDPPQTTLYELLEYAKTRSILKNSSSQGGVSTNSNNGSFVIRSLNSVQFNQNQPSNENSSIKSKKKIPIRISSLKRETKTAQTLSIVVVSFIACWLPFFIHYISKPFVSKDSIWTNAILEQSLMWIGWLNSSLNPFIYARFSNCLLSAPSSSNLPPESTEQRV